MLMGITQILDIFLLGTLPQRCILIIQFSLGYQYNTYTSAPSAVGSSALTFSTWLILGSPESPQVYLVWHLLCMAFRAHLNRQGQLEITRRPSKNSNFKTKSWASWQFPSIRMPCMGPSHFNTTAQHPTINFMAISMWKTVIQSNQFLTFPRENVHEKSIRSPVYLGFLHFAGVTSCRACTIIT